MQFLGQHFHITYKLFQTLDFDYFLPSSSFMDSSRINKKKKKEWSYFQNTHVTMCFGHMSVKKHYFLGSSRTSCNCRKQGITSLPRNWKEDKERRFCRSILMCYFSFDVRQLVKTFGEQSVFSSCSCSESQSLSWVQGSA